MSNAQSNDLSRFLSPDEIARFAMSLNGLPGEEIRKAKVLYLKNAISEYRAFLDTQANFGCMQIPFYVIPLFWPILYFQRKTLATGSRMMRERIQNALDVWKDDFGGEKFDIPSAP